MDFRGIDGGGGGSDGSSSRLIRQPSIYSLTFEEFQNSLGPSKDFGSMNMDELLKNIWMAEEAQTMAALSGTTALQRQPSLTLPRTLSQKTVDQVWKDSFKENSITMQTRQPLQAVQRQPTLGEITLEEFLVRAGLVREEPVKVVSNAGFLPYGQGLVGIERETRRENEGQEFPVRGGLGREDPGKVVFNGGFLPYGEGQVGIEREIRRENGGKEFLMRGGLVREEPAKVVTNGGFLPFGEGLVGIERESRREKEGQEFLVRGGLVREEPVKVVSSNGFLPYGEGQMGIERESRRENEGDDEDEDEDLSGGGGRGRRQGREERVVERRQRRMIKNRESAARSRARKQAYTMELEAEIVKLKELNAQLQKRQEEYLIMQKNQALETTNLTGGPKKPCLRRTLTGPW